MRCSRVSLEKLNCTTAAPPPVYNIPTVVMPGPWIPDSRDTVLVRIPVSSRRESSSSIRNKLVASLRTPLYASYCPGGAFFGRLLTSCRSVRHESPWKNAEPSHGRRLDKGDLHGRAVRSTGISRRGVQKGSTYTSLTIHFIIITFMFVRQRLYPLGAASEVLPTEQTLPGVGRRGEGTSTTGESNSFPIGVVWRSGAGVATRDTSSIVVMLPSSGRGVYGHSAEEVREARYNFHFAHLPLYSAEQTSRMLHGSSFRMDEFCNVTIIFFGRLVFECKLDSFHHNWGMIDR